MNFHVFCTKMIFKYIWEVILIQNVVTFAVLFGVFLI